MAARCFGLLRAGTTTEQRELPAACDWLINWTRHRNIEQVKEAEPR
jgi:hypothetical protein